MNVSCPDCQDAQRCLIARRCLSPVTMDAALDEVRAAVKDMNAAAARLNAGMAALMAAQAIEKGRRS